MRIWAYIFPFIFGAVGYFTYGWAATSGEHWMAIAVALCCLIAQQVSMTSLATTYAMECFDGVGVDRLWYLLGFLLLLCVLLTGFLYLQISGELVVVLAICSSLINFAISFSVQPFIDATNFGWTFTCFGILVVLSMLMGIPMMVWGKSWRRKCKGRYEKFLSETGRDIHPAL